MTAVLTLQEYLESNRVTEKHYELVAGKLIQMPPPKPAKRGNRYKRSEYAARGIAEYWIVDPQENMVTVLICDRGLYRETVHLGNESIYSPLFPQLQLTANQIFG